MAQYEIDDSDAYMTSDVGGPISDQNSLKAGQRGSTLLEDFILRQKITRFDHERVSSVFARTLTNILALLTHLPRPLSVSFTPVEQKHSESC